MELSGGMFVSKFFRGGIFAGRDNFSRGTSGGVRGGLFMVAILILVLKYKSVHAAFVICETVVNTYTHTQTNGRISSGYIRLSQLS